MSPTLHVTRPASGMDPTAESFEVDCLAIVVTDRRRTIYGEEAETHVEEATARIYLHPEADVGDDWPDPCKLFVIAESGRDPLGVYNYRSRIDAGPVSYIELVRRP